jgi:probable phosphoglycerate mutase
MLLFYVRHGDPIYSPDSLTPLGERQAEAVAKRLALYGVDRIYSSTSNRAILTSKPTCEILKKEPTLLEFAHENLAWKDLTVEREDGKGVTWLFNEKWVRELFNDKSIRDLGDRWYEHPAFAKHDYKKGIERIYNDIDAFFSELGYEHDRYTGKYKIKNANDKRIALFAHQGFGLAFLSHLTGIPYPRFTTHFDMCTSGMTVIEFENAGGYAYPKILTLSSDAHIYKEGLPTRYNGRAPF